MYIARVGGPAVPDRLPTDIKEWNSIASDRVRWLEKQSEAHLKELDSGYQEFSLNHSPIYAPEAEYSQGHD